MSAPWSKSEVSLLIDLWSQGVPTPEIGKRLGRNKDMVIGKAHRLELPKHPGTNALGYGVRQRPSGRFYARIKANGTHFCLGTFDTAEEARAAYLDAARRYGRIAA